MSKDEMQPISLKYAHQLEQVGEKLFWICIYFGKRYSVAQLIFNITPFQIRSATGQHRRDGGVSGGGKGRGQGL